MWTAFWGFVILFSIFSFSYMSVKVLYNGIDELKDMFEHLNKQKNK